MKTFKERAPALPFSIEDLPVAAYVLGGNGRILFSNESFRSLVGFATAELTELSVPQVESLGFSITTAGEASFARDAGLPKREFERQFTRHDGTKIPVKIKSSLVQDEEAQQSCSLNIVLDQSELLSVKDDLNKAERRFQTLYENAPFSVQLLDARGNMIGVNQAWLDLWHIDLAANHSLAVYNLFHDEQLRKLGVADAILPALDGKATATPTIYYDPALIGLKGRARWVVGYVHPIVNEAGKVTQIILIHHDMSEHVRAQAALEKAKEQAEVSNRLKSAFVANMSHEIRTPLTAIMGFNELLQSIDLPQETRFEYHEIIKRSGASLTHLINDILELSVVEAGALPLAKTAANLRGIIKEVTDLLNIEAQKKSVALESRLDADAPPWVLTDPFRLKQILINLVGNALKFTAQGAVTIHVAPSDSENLAIAIHDTGIGIRSEDQGKLFEPFSQVDNSNTRAFGGTGLGLALSRKIARALGGDIQLLASTPGQGSTFVLSHPLVAAEPKTLAPITSDSPSHVVRATSDHSLADIHVLVVDDALENRRLIQEALKAHGAQVETANNGREGLDKARQAHHDVILMDIQMPHMDGLEATRELRRTGFTKPVIALSARVTREDVQRCLSAGCNAHAPKPIDVAKLVAQIKSCLGEVDVSG